MDEPRAVSESLPALEPADAPSAPQGPTESMGRTRPCLNAPAFLSSALFVYLNLGAVLLSFLLLYIYLPPGAKCPVRAYNASRLSSPTFGAHGKSFHRLLVVTDLDHESKAGDHWHAFLKRGVLELDEDHTQAVVRWDAAEDVVLRSDLAANGRAMELSDLAVFDGHLLTVDDRTGLIYRILVHDDQQADIVPWVFLNDGPGNSSKGFKAEWMTVKQDTLIVGGLGKEWTTGDGRLVNHHPMWVKAVSAAGEVLHLDWEANFKALRAPLGIDFPGYMIHESGQWSDTLRKWVFMPRRVSADRYDENTDESKGSDIVLLAAEDFSSVQVLHVGEKGDGSRGFSAFQFLQGTGDDVLVALKSEERDGKPVGSFITVFRLSDGRVLLPETALQGAHKFEGIAFA